MSAFDWSITVRTNSYTRLVVTLRHRGLYVAMHTKMALSLKNFKALPTQWQEDENHERKKNEKRPYNNREKKEQQCSKLY